MKQFIYKLDEWNNIIWVLVTSSDCPYLVSAAQFIQISKSPPESRKADSTLAE